jgi:hypothetical protein
MTSDFRIAQLAHHRRRPRVRAGAGIKGTAVVLRAPARPRGATDAAP